MYDASEQYKLSTDLAGFVYLARQKTLSYQRCMKEVTYSQSTYIQQVGIGSCMYNVEPLYVFDRDIWNTVQDRGKTNLDAPFTHINFFPSITLCVARLPLCMKWTWLALLSPSGDLGISLVWHNLSPPHPTPPDSFLVRLMKSSSNWTKLSMRGPQLFSAWYQMILGVFRCSQLFSDVFQLFSDDVFRLLKSSSSWTKLSMVGPQLFSGWYQMILDVFRCSA